VAPVPVIFSNQDEGATGPSHLGTGDDALPRGPGPAGVNNGRVAPVPVIFPNQDEGATGPSHLGTGDDALPRGPGPAGVNNGP